MNHPSSLDGLEFKGFFVRPLSPLFFLPGGSSFAACFQFFVIIISSIITVILILWLFRLNSMRRRMTSRKCSILISDTTQCFKFPKKGLKVIFRAIWATTLRYPPWRVTSGSESLIPAIICFITSKLIWRETPYFVNYV